jgi:hypothetical protein
MSPRPAWSAPSARPSGGTYLWGGFAVGSNVSLPRLHRTGRRPELRFTWRTGGLPPGPAAGYRASVRHGDGTGSGLRVSGDAARLRYEVEEVGTFLVASRAGEVDFHPGPAPDPMRVEHELVHGVLATLAGLRSVLCLHAAAAADGGEAVLFAGPSGTGKSTAAWRVVAGGGTLIADDVAVLRPDGGRWVVHPAARTLRLAGLGLPGAWDNRGKDEVLLETARGPTPVREVRLLAGGPLPEERALTRAAVHRSLLGLQGGWPWAGAEARRDLEEMLWDLTARVPVVVQGRDRRAAVWGTGGQAVSSSSRSLPVPRVPAVRSQTSPRGSTVGAS